MDIHKPDQTPLERRPNPITLKPKRLRKLNYEQPPDLLNMQNPTKSNLKSHLNPRSHCRAVHTAPALTVFCLQEVSLQGCAHRSSPADNTLEVKLQGCAHRSSPGSICLKSSPKKPIWPPRERQRFNKEKNLPFTHTQPSQMLQGRDLKEDQVHVRWWQPLECSLGGG